ncbi:asparagine synthase (glutamine-hydrolyzing) [Tianweitania sp. BSSL-BM11]|uniref:asparagine synthase (glutamine-hydrolyzing) n=1 Tax=Tianweitania aestuarii TaxID=2814886 RepID=A0ABS5RRP0_9HYPH|nr:asparagine synthase (glutamine-hydrolyzing) [Tianweitania aestuarii]MBS9719465.1 asparagine synthase (glutamine-hydrolyzing) [Tianweitania aestuarii]
MCGVAGIFDYAAQSPRCFDQELRRVCDAMKQRGPDGFGHWSSSDNRLQLGHRRLSVIAPGPQAAQPMADVSERFIISFNGEIYNHRALRTDLEARGYRFRTQSDTEVILNLYAAEGAEACAKLQGMFAFAIYDTVARSLFLARDPYGIKPLYLSDDGQTLRFASQVKALLAGGGVDTTIDPAGLAGFALFGHVPEPFTSYRAIRPLPAGHHLTIREGRVGQPMSFACLASSFATHQQQDAEGTTICRQALQDSVGRHLEADVELGVFLSGGVDSGAVLGLMRDRGGAHPIKAITLAFEDLAGTDVDEVPLAREIAAHYEADHHIHRISRDDLAANVPAILAAMDQPTIDGINTWFVAKAARELGLKVALSGIGGDELFGGYSTFRSIPAMVRATALTANMPRLGAAVRRIGSGLLPNLQATNPKALAAFELGGTYPGAYLLRRGLFLPHELPALLGRDIAREGLQRLDPLGLIAGSLEPGVSDPLLRVAAMESGNYLRNQLLRDADWAGMAHGVEIRTPLVDFQLLQTVAPHLAGIIRSKNGKALLASAPSKPLPFSVLQRSKTGFSVPMESLLSGQRNANTRLTSRLWARQVLQAFTGQTTALAA